MAPIKGLTDHTRLPRLGKIRSGELVTNESGVSYPRALDHFVVPPDVAAVYGDAPTRLEVVLPVDDEAVFASTYYRYYTRSFGLTCRGDGEKAERKVDKAALEASGDLSPASGKTDPKNIMMREVTCPCELLEKRDCRPICNLQFLLPKVPGLGVWQLDTSSLYGIRNILDCVRFIKALTGGRVAGLPLTLSLQALEVTPRGQKTRTVHVPRLDVVDMTLVELRAVLRGSVGQPLLALPEPDDEQPEEITPDAEQRAAAQAAEARTIGPLDIVPPRTQTPAQALPVAKGEGVPCPVHDGAMLREYHPANGGTFWGHQQGDAWCRESDKAVLEAWAGAMLKYGRQLGLESKEQRDAWVDQNVERSLRPEKGHTWRPSHFYSIIETMKGKLIK